MFERTNPPANNHSETNPFDNIKKMGMRVDADACNKKELKELFKKVATAPETKRYIKRLLKILIN